MSSCQHRWRMTNIEFGFIAFEKCSHCNTVRTHFSTDESPGDQYREGDCNWNRVENAQSFRFDLECDECKTVVNYSDLMGLLYCTGCLDDCPVEIEQRECAKDKTWLLVAFGFLPMGSAPSLPEEKLVALTDYFNQRRDTARSRIKIVSYELIDNFSICKGDFIHDRGMLSMEAPADRESLL